MENRPDRERRLPAALLAPAGQTNYAAAKAGVVALTHSLAKEVARAILPEGTTPTRMMMSGTIRDWLHYCALRRGNGTQPEHQEIVDRQ